MCDSALTGEAPSEHGDANTSAPKCSFVVQGLQTGDLFVLFGAAAGQGWRLGAGGGERGCCTPPNCLPQPGTGSASAPSDSAASPARPSLNTAHLAKGGGVPPHCSVTWRH